MSATEPIRETQPGQITTERGQENPVPVRTKIQQSKSNKRVRLGWLRRAQWRPPRAIPERGELPALTVRRSNPQPQWRR